MTKIQKLILKLDYVNLFVLIGFCFFSFSHVSSMVTGFFSTGFIEGHFSDWYEYNKNIELYNSLPSIYWILAIWNYIPVKIFNLMPPAANSPHVIFIWYKLGTSLVLLFSAKIFYKILYLLTSDNFKSKVATLMWITTPLLIYSQFIFSSFEVFSVFFVLCGFYYYLLDQKVKFSIFFGLAFTFKYMPLLIFGPLLLFVEKKLVKLLKYTLIFLTPYLLEVLVYKKSLYFKETVLKMKPIKQKFFEPLFSMHSPSIHVILLLVVGVCALAFWLQKNRDEEGFKRWSIYIPFLSLTSFFLFVNWEPAWFLILTPFLVLNVLFNKQSTFLILIEIVLYYFFIAALAGNFTKNADQELFFYGIFNANTDLFMKSLFYPRIASWNYTMVTSCLLILSVYKFPFEEFLSKSYFKFQVPNKNLMRIRFQLGVLIFLIPGLLTLNSEKYLWILFSLLFFPVLQWILIFFFLKRSGNEIQNLFIVDV